MLNKKIEITTLITHVYTRTFLEEYKTNKRNYLVGGV